MHRRIRFPYWLIIILLAAFAVGYFAWSESLRDDPSMTANSPNPLFSKEGAKGELERGEVGELLGWQTYRNEEYGYQINYPKSWLVLSPGGGQFGEECSTNAASQPILILSQKELETCGFVGEQLPPEEAEITIAVYDRFGSLNVLGDPDERLVIGSEPATKYFFTEKSELPDTQAARVYFNHKDKGFLIFLKQIDKKGNYDSILDQILSTFRFIE